jgi:hypothetical protein
MLDRFVGAMKTFATAQGVPLIAFERGAVTFDFSCQLVALNHYYFYVPGVGPGLLKFGTYIPYPITLYLNGHEWVKQQLRRADVTFDSLDNGFLACAEPTRLQTICDQLGPADVQAFFDRWTHDDQRR